MSPPTRMADPTSGTLFICTSLVLAERVSGLAADTFPTGFDVEQAASHAVKVMLNPKATMVRRVGEGRLFMPDYSFTTAIWIKDVEK
ncbi:MAG: hypothetical protein U0640_12450 [Phycisphaerales bacterium]